jgi:polysaccharide pyruvyl transferase WcaK-like protein
MPDRLRRANVSVTPYLQGMKGHDRIFTIYKHASLVLGNRFHSNVCSYALNSNVIGLVNYPKIRYLYKELISDEWVDVTLPGYEDTLLEMAIYHLSDKEKYVNRQRQAVDGLISQAKQTYGHINEWLSCITK